MEHLRPGVYRNDDDRILTHGNLLDALALVGEVVIEIQRRQEQLTEANLWGDIGWSQRQQLRTIGGHLKKAEYECIEFVYGLGTDDGEALAEELWPES